MLKNILAIETSCDETAAAVVQTNGQVLSNIIASQIDTHKEYGGVIPEIASRMHVEAINITIEKALQEAKTNLADIAAIAVTQGPGLLGSLLIGLQAAKTLAYLQKIPLIGINHMEGHIFANFLNPTEPSAELKINYPFLCLVVSGGHTQIVIAEAGHYRTIGRTIDDAAGESYDKVARMLQLGYPGGPIIDKMAQTGDPHKIQFTRARFKDTIDGGEFGFSFSGLKTAVLNYYRKHPDEKKEDICASFQRTVIETLVDNTMAAAERYDIRNVYLAGGVAANKSLRETLVKEGKKRGMVVGIPSLKFCTDNAAMIGGAAIPKFLKLKASGGVNPSASLLTANPGLKL